MIADQTGLRKARSAMTGGMDPIVVVGRGVEKTALWCSKLRSPRQRGRKARVRLIFESVAIFFDDGVGEHFARDPLHFSLRLGFVEPVFQRQFKELALTHVA